MIGILAPRRTLDDNQFTPTSANPWCPHSPQTPLCDCRDATNEKVTASPSNSCGVSIEPTWKPALSEWQTKRPRRCEYFAHHHPVVRGDCHKRVVPHQFTNHSLTHFIAPRMRVAGRTRRPGVRHFACTLAGLLTHRPYLLSFPKHHIRHRKGAINIATHPLS
jgi:hypothetical protein